MFTTYWRRWELCLVGSYVSGKYTIFPDHSRQQKEETFRMVSSHFPYVHCVDRSLVILSRLDGHYNWYVNPCSTILLEQRWPIMESHVGQQ